MEDSAACVGVLVAAGGIAVSQYTHMIIWDGLAGLTVAGIMGYMGLYLARMNQRFLLGQAIDAEIVNKIQTIIMDRPSVEGMHSIQSQWIGANSFAYKAEVEIDGTYLAAKLLNRYQKEFMTYINKRVPSATGCATGLSTASDEDEIRLLLSWYAEDVMRVVEQEVKEIEWAIRKEFPEAQYIEIEPDSSLYESGETDDPTSERKSKLNHHIRQKFRYAIDDGRLRPSDRHLEIATIKLMQDQLKREGTPSSAPQ